MVDKTLLASKIAAIRDAAARVREVLPADRVALAADRTAREVVLLNLFVAIQECMSLATHWLADEGLDVPGRSVGIPQSGGAPVRGARLGARLRHGR
jgi:uncharacterized protein YutE (UPF0331/DUF86 family)